MVKLFKRDKKLENIALYRKVLKDYKSLAQKYEERALRYQVAKARLEETREGLNTLKSELERLLSAENDSLESFIKKGKL